MPLAVSVVGKSNSGKTTLLEKLVGELRRRGLNIAAIKHTSSDFDLDHPGKDSWRLARAGSQAVLLSSPQKLALIRSVDREASVEELLALAGEGFDLVLVEGFKNSGLPKIEVHRREQGGLLFAPRDLLALVTDEAIDASTPQFSADDVGPLADLLERMALTRRLTDEVSLVVNGVPVQLNGLTQDIIQRMLLGMLTPLAGDQEVKNLRITLQRGQA
ncbi:MAG: molybdopterin-guanine dinucleotide biosynthesis protein B [Chloroflexi bacterium]|nr:MAG: molybdopterin-guanine dinucleotide biosynthesis protein B [Chloroflexota bacterium]RLC94718.1 MAG: molybdopterin-guanine dinucleotide biosynthesis protein B [Chloroflexota bacterium]